MSDLSGVVCCSVFFVKQKAAYDMRMSDWSSDVCSSDLKMSKSRGTFVMARTWIDSGLQAEALRYYFAAKSSGGVDDLDLNLSDFVARVNSDVVGKFVNLASRCAGFIHKRLDGRLEIGRAHV